jgi:hypothetical protein
MSIRSSHGVASSRESNFTRQENEILTCNALDALILFKARLKLLREHGDRVDYVLNVDREGNRNVKEAREFYRVALLELATDLRTIFISMDPMLKHGDLQSRDWIYELREQWMARREPLLAEIPHAEDRELVRHLIFTSDAAMIKADRPELFDSQDVKGEGDLGLIQELDQFMAKRVKHGPGLDLFEKEREPSAISLIEFEKPVVAIIAHTPALIEKLPACEYPSLTRGQLICQRHPVFWKTVEAWSHLCLGIRQWQGKSGQRAR